MNIALGAISQGLIWSIMVIGVYISYRILDFPDMTADGAIALGGAISAVCLIQNINPIITLLIVFICGNIAGFITGFLHTKLQIPKILSGILTMISLYSINIEIMGRANISLLSSVTIIDNIALLLNINNTYATIILAITILIILIISLNYFFKTEIGTFIRATGDNETMVKAQGKNPETYKIIGISLSNGIIALCGGILAQQQGYAEVTMGTGTIIIGLAAIIIGEVLLNKKDLLLYKFISIILGSILYRIMISIVLYIGLKPTMLNLLTAVLVTIALSSTVIKKKIFNRRNKLCLK